MDISRNRFRHFPPLFDVPFTPSDKNRQMQGVNDNLLQNGGMQGMQNEVIYLIIVL